MRIEWGKESDKYVEQGLDRGVIYPRNHPPVVWNGLTSVEDDTTEQTTPLYFDGIKFDDLQSTGEPTSAIKAYTYPDILDDLVSYKQVYSGIFAGDQQSTMFDLTYRTEKTGGYEIHLVYNLLAKIDDRSYTSNGSTISPIEFGWTVSAIPCEVEGFAPTEHFIIDSTEIDSSLLAVFENVLYGTDEEDPSMPPIVEFSDSASNWHPMIVTINTLEGFATLTPGTGDVVEDHKMPNFYKIIPGSRISESDVPGLYVME